MIRQANKFDVNYFIECVHKVHMDDDVGYFPGAELDDEYLSKMFNGILHGLGLALVYEKDNKPIAIMVGMKSPNVWCPDILFMHQMLLYVEEEHRKGTIAYRLIKKFTDECKNLQIEQKINFFTINAPTTMHNLDFSRFGYTKDELIWVCDTKELING